MLQEVQPNVNLKEYVISNVHPTLLQLFACKLAKVYIQLNQPSVPKYELKIFVLENSLHVYKSLIGRSHMEQNAIMLLHNGAKKLCLFSPRCAQKAPRCNTAC